MESSAALETFAKSLLRTYEDFKYERPYALDAIPFLTPADREAAAALVMRYRDRYTWDELEALARLDTPMAHAELLQQLHQGTAYRRLEVTYLLRERAPAGLREAAIIDGLVLPDGLILKWALELAQAFPTLGVVQRLLDIAAEGGHIRAEYAAGLLLFLYGKVAEPYERNDRFYQRFSGNGRDQKAAFRELCARLGIPFRV